MEKCQGYVQKSDSRVRCRRKTLNNSSFCREHGCEEIAKLVDLSQKIQDREPVASQCHSRPCCFPRTRIVDYPAMEHRNLPLYLIREHIRKYYLNCVEFRSHVQETEIRVFFDCYKSYFIPITVEQFVNVFNSSDCYCGRC